MMHDIIIIIFVEWEIGGAANELIVPRKHKFS